jgi:hypothetical protein
VFNFERPEKSDFTETVRTLAGLCRFIIADITSPRSTPLELQATVPEYMITFIPIIEDGEESGGSNAKAAMEHQGRKVHGACDEVEIEGAEIAVEAPEDLATFGQAAPRSAERATRSVQQGSRRSCAPHSAPRPA